MLKEALIFTGVTLFCNPLFAQSEGVQSIVRALDSSTNQWLCSELERSYPSYFENDYCPPKLDFNSLSSEHPELFPELSSNDELEKSISRALLQEDCNRFIHLKALGDLYFPSIDSILQLLEIPSSFRYLPVALSGMNPSYSTGNRAGFWQLSALESLRYGVQSNDSIDYRYDLKYSTLSASYYIKDLRSRLPYDEAVFAALREGLAPVLKRLKAVNGDLSAFLEACPRSTIEWMKGYKAISSYFVHLSTPNRREAMLEIRSKYRAVYPSKTANFDAFGSVLQISVSELRDLNQVYPGQLVPANHALVLPQGLIDQYRLLEDSLYTYREREIQRLKALEEADKKRIAELKKQEEIIHTVRSGEVLGLIAQRYSVSINDIRNWNNLKRDLIYVGQKLSIFRSSRKESPPPPEKPENLPRVTTTTNETVNTYTVKSGDNLWIIAKKYPGVSAENIMEWNNIGADLKPGMKLKIKTVD